MLAATLSPVYGIYSGFERCENVPLTESSEEYLNSEKYEIKKRSLGGPLLPMIARLNAARRANPALRQLDNITFLETENEPLIAYLKRTRRQRRDHLRQPRRRGAARGRRHHPARASACPRPSTSPTCSATPPSPGATGATTSASSPACSRPTCCAWSCDARRAALAALVREQRWFGAQVARRWRACASPTAGRSRGIAASRCSDVAFIDGAGELYQLPYRSRGHGRLEVSLADPALARALSRRCARGEPRRPEGGTSSSSCRRRCPTSATPRPIGGEQSNSSIVFGERAILKAYRRLEPGESPELELLRFLARHGFEHAPRLLGCYRHAGPPITATLGILQDVRPGRARRLGVRARLVRRPGAVPREPAAPGRGHGPHACRCSRATARPGLRARAARRRRARVGCARGRGRRPRAARRARARRSRRGRARPRDRGARVPARAARGSAAGRSSASTATTTSARCCGRAATGSCSTSRASPRARSPSAAARARRCATSRACCARSPTPPRPARSARRDRRPPAGSDEARTAFLSGYAASIDPPAARRRRRARRLLAACELEKALYELRYELDNRPDWVHVPVAGILRLLGREG